MTQNKSEQKNDDRLPQNKKMCFAAAYFQTGDAMSRREIREHIFKMLFGAEFFDEAEIDQQMELYFEQVLDEELESPPAFISQENREYIKEKAGKVLRLAPQIDESINQVAKGWKTTRMGKAELTILRLAVYEMKYDEDIPVGVAINEAVELAKKFGSEEAPAFVNGILAKLV